MNLEQNRRSLFWLLQKWSSYTVWAHYAKQFDVFVKAYEEALASWPDGERPPEYNLRFAYQAQEFYSQGLAVLAKGGRSVWRQREDGYLLEAASSASSAMQGITSQEINNEYGGEHGTPQYAKWTPRLEQLRLLKIAASPIAAPLIYESRPTYADWLPIAYQFIECLPEDYLESICEKYGPCPIPCPLTPDVSNILIESGECIPIDGIWELVLLHRASGKTDCLNYFVKGGVAPWIEDIEHEYIPGKQFTLPATWRLVWEDTRYLSGVIPDESEYLADYTSYETPPSVDTIQAVAPSSRIEADKTCPQTGYWHTPAKQNSRALFKQGDVMPDFPDSSYGATIWYWDTNQD